MPGERARVRIAGRSYLLLTLSARPRRVRSKGHTYYQYTLNIPRSILPELLEKAGAGEGQLLPLTLILAASPWHHLIDWSQMPPNAWKDLPERVRRELEALGLSPESGEEKVLISAARTQIEQLGLDPGEPITLDDIIEKVREQLARELGAKPAASPSR